MRLDWWTVGVCLYEFLVGLPPFFEDDLEDTYNNILTRSLEWPADMSPDAKDLIDKLLTIDPSQRLGANGADEVKKHPFFKGIDWDNLYQAEASFIPFESHIENTSYFHNSSTDDRDSTVPTFEDLAHTQPQPIHQAEAGFDAFQFKNLALLHEINISKSKTVKEASLYLPTASMVADNTNQKQIILSDKPVHCLVVEDNPVTQLLAKALMKQLGISMTQANNGFEAVQKGTQTKFDIIFMDIMMPGMDGMEATKVLRTDEKSLNKKTPIIAFTALSDSPAQNYMNVGMNGLLAKPFTKNELYNILQKWLSNDRKDKLNQ